MDVGSIERIRAAEAHLLDVIAKANRDIAAAKAQRDETVASEQGAYEAMLREARGVPLF